MMDQKEAKRLLQICIPKMRIVDDNDEEDDKKKELLLDELSLTNKKVKCKSICRLWGGMGYVYEVSVQDSVNTDDSITMIVKRVSPLAPHNSTSIGDLRKAESYQVEAKFYQNVAPQLFNTPTTTCNIPYPYHAEYGTIHDPVTICMSKLKGHQPYSIDKEETFAVLRWMASFHASTWYWETDSNRSSNNNQQATTSTHQETDNEDDDDIVTKYGLQSQGTYWYLDTRVEEHQSMSRKGWQGRLRNAAKAIDSRLKRDTKLQCCVHGDAKDANMLFHHGRDNNGELQVSMYDFQYCGKGPCTKDLAYFLCVAVQDRNDSLYVEFYYNELIQRLKSSLKKKKGKRSIPSLLDIQESLQLAYCDWARFMCGWGFWGHDITEEVIAVLDRLDNGHNLGSEEAYDLAVRREFG